MPTRLTKESLEQMWGQKAVASGKATRLVFKAVVG